MLWQCQGMRAPMVHLNGTSQQSLLDAYKDAATAVSRAMDALVATAPNGRDYYPLGDNALREALVEHRARMLKLAEVKDELAAIFRAVKQRAVTTEEAVRDE